MDTYFPDTNLLVGYLTDSSELNDLSKKLVLNTGNSYRFEGIITSGVESEFYGICGDSSLIRAVKLGRKLLSGVRNASSTKIFGNKIDAYINTYESLPSEKIVLKEIKHDLKEYTGKTDQVGLYSFMGLVQLKIKRRRFEIESRYRMLTDTQKSQTGYFKQQASNAINQIRTFLSNCFPIRHDHEESDKKDNEHIVNSLIYCATNSLKNSWFVTDDNFRRHRDFNLHASRASQKISAAFKIQLYILKVEDFLGAFKIS